MKAPKEEIAEHFCQNMMIQFIRTKQMYVVSQSPTRVHLVLQEVGSSSSSRLSVAPVIVGDLCCLSDRLLACLPCRKSRSPEAKLETKIGEWTLPRLGRATQPPTHPPMTSFPSRDSNPESSSSCSPLIELLTLDFVVILVPPSFTVSSSLCYEPSGHVVDLATVPLSLSLYHYISSPNCCFFWG
jgi:hypothetical protein